MKLPETCCGVLNLKQGSFVIGTVLLALYTMSALGCIILLVLLGTPQSDEPQLEQKLQSDGSPVTVVSEAGHAPALIPLIVGPCLALTVVHLLFNGLLVHGARVNRPCLLVTWLVYQSVTIAVSVVGTVITFVLSLRMSEYVLLVAVFGTLVGLVIMLYFFVVVLAFYRELRRTPVTVVLRPPEGMPMVPIA